MYQAGLLTDSKGASEPKTQIVAYQAHFTGTDPLPLNAPGESFHE